MSSSSSSHTIFIDDADTSRIQYQTIQLGPYRGKGFTPYSGVSTDDKAGPIYDGTLSATVVEDVSAAVTFSGTRVSVYGSLRPSLQTDVPPPLTKYSIPEWDYGGVPAMIPYQAPNVTSPQNDINFFTSDILPYGTYTLTINVTTASSDAPFYLDYIAVEVPGSAPSSSTPSSSNSLQSTASSTSTHLPIQAFTPQDRPPIGPIVGGCLAGVLGVLVAFAVFFCYFKQKHRMMPPEYNYGNCTMAQKDATPHVVPFADSEVGVSIGQPGDLGLMFVPGRSSLGSRPSSSSRPNSPPPSAAYYHSLATTPPLRDIASTVSTSPSNGAGTCVLAHEKRILSAANGDLIVRSSLTSSNSVTVPSSIPVNRVEDVLGDELPPVYSRTPLPGENSRSENVSGVNDDAGDEGTTASRGTLKDNDPVVHSDMDMDSDSDRSNFKLLYLFYVLE
ncbi:hypothetical protein GSI_11609 [Ganoderma sinense ZZ0214-1]|uniref:Uncharacterized protein n=1 Tax=Ganoderma sinense ZZ0214-1 TaxID=1077348 RepID=A0A2G8RWG0_9APHY|nr:hypothetical protein GSI_11609 [Ganoderma sinense ZZ0214-1]